MHLGSILVVRVRIRVFVSLSYGRQVANWRCVNSMCTLSYDKVHTVYHGHSRVPRPTAPFQHPPRGTPSVAFPFRKMCSITKTPSPSPRVGATSEVTMALLVSIRLERELDFGFQCKASHSIRLMGPTWAQRRPTLTGWLCVARPTVQVEVKINPSMMSM